jgi:hypothetical protein
MLICLPAARVAVEAHPRSRLSSSRGPSKVVGCEAAALRSRNWWHRTHQVSVQQPVVCVAVPSAFVAAALLASCPSFLRPGAHLTLEKTDERKLSNLCCSKSGAYATCNPSITPPRLQPGFLLQYIFLLPSCYSVTRTQIGELAIKHFAECGDSYRSHPNFTIHSELLGAVHSGDREARVGSLADGGLAQPRRRRRCRAADAVVHRRRAQGGSRGFEGDECGSTRCVLPPPPRAPTLSAVLVRGPLWALAPVYS